MATSKLIKGDTLTETSNAADGFILLLKTVSIAIRLPAWRNRYITSIKPKPLNRKCLVTIQTGHNMTVASGTGHPK